MSPREKHISWFFNPNSFCGIDWEACYHPQPIHPALLHHPQLNIDAQRSFRCPHRFQTFSLTRAFVQCSIVVLSLHQMQLNYQVWWSKRMAAQVRNTIFCLGVSSPLLFQPNSPFFLVSCLLSFLLCFFSSWGTASPLEASFPPHSPLTCKSLRKCKILRFGISINACPNQWENISTSRLS